MKRSIGVAVMVLGLAATAALLQGLAAAPAAAAKAQEVAVVNTPLLVREVAPPAAQGTNLSGIAEFNHGDTQAVVSLGTVPADNRLAVEFVSALASLPGGQRVHIRLFSSVQHFFAPAFVGTDATHDVLVLSQPTKYYVDGPVSASVTRFGSNSGAGTVQIALSGHLVQ
jgi:hypothetical protein